MTRAEIRRDPYGVPHVVADDADALAFAQGLVTARDRSWQLDAGRRRSEGTLAAVAGPVALDWDVLARRAELDVLARSAYRALDLPTRRWLRAYVRGVNRGLAEPAAAETVEHRATASAPAPWWPWTPLGVLAVRHVLFGSFAHTLWRAHVIATLGEDALDVLTAEVEAHSGSNAWAVPGRLTASGAPLLAGDPHRVVEAPGVYQQVRLTCPELDVVGLAFPGVPGVQHVGHTGSVAWGVTNAMADAEDLVVEALRRDATGGVLVREVHGWVPAVARMETVEVRGAADVAVEVVRTARGPVVLGGLRLGDGEATGLALRTPARVLGDLGLAAVPPLLRARTVADVEAALSRWVEPVNSVLVADTTGRVRRLVAGRVPVRDEVNRRGPVAAIDPRHAWTGWADLPAADADGALLVAANDRRPGDTAELGARFAAPHRARRIRARLEGRQGLTVADCEELQTDTLLGTVPALRRLLRRVPSGDVSAPAAELRAQILDWDGRMNAESGAADALASWRDALVRALTADPALAPLHRPHGYPEILHPWLDVEGRVATSLEAIAARGERLGVDVVAAAAAALEAAAGRPPGRTWGERHVLRPLHALAGTAGEPELPAPALDGDADCVLATSSVPGVTAVTGRAPVARYVWDLGAGPRGRWVVPLGASGRWDSPHALDQLPRWLAGGLVPVPGDAGPTALEEVLDVDPHDPDEVRHTLEAPGTGRLTLHRVDPDADGAVVHPWVVQERAGLWEMLAADVEDVRAAYGVVDVLTVHDAFLVRCDGEPIAVLQVYDPAHDPVGEAYPVRPGDLGIHLLHGPIDRPGLTAALVVLLREYARDVLGARRVLAEPDAANRAALLRLAALGFTLGDEVDLPGRRARLAFLELVPERDDGRPPGGDRPPSAS